MVQPKRCYMPPASDGKCPTTKREWYSEGLGNKRIQFFLSIGIFPFSPRGFSEGLKCRISPDIRIERVLRNERIVRETEFMRSWRDVEAEHTAIVDAVRKRDADAAVAALSQHFSITMQFVELEKWLRVHAKPPLRGQRGLRIQLA